MMCRHQCRIMTSSERRRSQARRSAARFERARNPAVRAATNSASVTAAHNATKSTTPRAPRVHPGHPTTPQAGQPTCSAGYNAGNPGGVLRPVTSVTPRQFIETPAAPRDARKLAAQSDEMRPAFAPADFRPTSRQKPRPTRSASRFPIASATPFDTRCDRRLFTSIALFYSGCCIARNSSRTTLHVRLSPSLPARCGARFDLNWHAPPYDHDHSARSRASKQR